MDQGCTKLKSPQWQNSIDASRQIDICGTLIQYIKKSLIFIFNVSINQGIFPDLMKIEKKTIFKKGDWYDSNITNLDPFYQFFFFFKKLRRADL